MFNGYNCYTTPRFLFIQYCTVIICKPYRLFFQKFRDCQAGVAVFEMKSVFQQP